MSENRVNVTYSVEFTKVPEAVSDLVNKIYNSDYRSLSKDFDELLAHLNEQNEKQAIKKIEDIRRKLMNIDFCMSDSEGILSSYQKYLISAKEDNDGTQSI